MFSTDLEFVTNYINNSGNIDKAVHFIVFFLFFSFKTLARHCVENGSIDSLSLLLEKGCQKQYLIHSAVTFQQLESLKTLIKYGCDVNELSKKGQTPLLLAIRKNLLEFGKVLLENKANVQMFVEGQLHLYHAASLGHLEFVKLLIEYNSPLTAIQPHLPPLYASIEYCHFDVTSFLLSKGADPNLIVNLSEPAKDVKDKFLSILEIALLKKDSRTVSLLIMCGANVDDVDTSQVPPSTLSSLFQYKCSNPPFDNEDDQLQLQISDLSDSVSEVKEKTSYLLRERINSKEIVFKKNSLTNVVNEIRLQYVSFAKAVSLAKRIVETIKSKRMKLLDLLFKTLIAEDKEMFSKALDKDNEEWKIFCNMAIERLQKRLSESSEENQKKFANFCIDRILEEQQKLENEKNQIMNVFPEVENIEINDDKKRTLLLAQNLIYTKVKPMIETLIRLLNEFHEESVKAIELRINFFENSIETIDMFSKSHHSLERIGLSDIIIAQLESNNQPKEEIFEKSKEQLKEHLVLTKGLAKAMQDTLLYLLQ